MPNGHGDQIHQLTIGELDRYASQLTRCLKALDTTAPIRVRVQDELAAVRAEQDARTTAGPPAAPRRRYHAGGLTDIRRRAGADPARASGQPGPDPSGLPGRVPILAHMAAIDTELADRVDQQS